MGRLNSGKFEFAFLLGGDDVADFLLDLSGHCVEGTPGGGYGYVFQGTGLFFQRFLYTFEDRGNLRHIMNKIKAALSAGLGIMIISGVLLAGCTNFGNSGKPASQATAQSNLMPPAAEENVSEARMEYRFAGPGV